MVGPNEHGEFPFRGAFNRLGAIASRGAAGARLAHLLKRRENLQAQGKRLSPDECLDMGLANFARADAYGATDCFEKARALIDATTR